MHKVNISITLALLTVSSWTLVVEGSAVVRSKVNLVDLWLQDLVENQYTLICMSTSVLSNGKSVCTMLHRTGHVTVKICLFKTITKCLMTFLLYVILCFQ